MNQATEYLKAFHQQETECKTLSGRTFMLQELTGAQQVMADSISASTSDAMYFRLAVSLISCDGVPFPPLTSKAGAKATGPDIMRRLTYIRGSEADELVLAYVNAFQPTGEELKNESTPVAAS
jgi:hypothetical protein